MVDWFENERLHRAAEEGDLPAVQELLGCGCPINVFDQLGKTPLHYAVLREHFVLVKHLLSKGADINAHDVQKIGNTPLSEAASTCSLQMAQLLVASGADPTVQGWMQLNAVDRAKQRESSEGIGSEGQAVYVFLQEATRMRKSRR